MHTQLITLLLFTSICLVACDTNSAVGEEKVETLSLQVTEESQNDCHDPSLDVCVDPTDGYDYSQDICK